MSTSNSAATFLTSISWPLYFSMAEEGRTVTELNRPSLLDDRVRQREPEKIAVGVVSQIP